MNNSDLGLALYDSFEQMLAHTKVTGNKLRLIFIMVEAGRIQIADEGGITHTAVSNDLLITKLDILIEQSMMSPDFKARILVFEEQALRTMWGSIFSIERELWGKLQFLRHHPVIHFTEQDLEVGNHITALAEILQSRFSDPHRSAIITPLILQLFGNLLLFGIQDLTTTDNQQSEPPLSTIHNSQGPTRADNIFRDFIALLSTQNPRPRFCHWYADRLCISEKYLSTICQRVSGKTASHWINEAIADDIRRLLRRSDITIKEISVQLDFPNLSFFGKFTKAHLGMSPTTYRKKLSNRTIF